MNAIWPVSFSQMAEIVDTNIFVLRFTEDGKFWGSRMEDVLQLSDVEQVLMDHSGKCPETVLSKGDLCMVLYNEKIWTRGEICNLLASVSGTRAEVFLIDRGIFMTLTLRRCLPLPSELLEHPPLAKLYSLKGLKPCKLTSGMWSEQVLEFYLNLIGGKQGLETLVKATIEPGNETTLYITFSGVTVSFNDCLVHANLAIRQSRDEVHTVEPACEIHENVIIDVYRSPSEDNNIKPDEAEQTTQGVYVEGRELKPLTLLSESSFSASVQKGLMSLGFRSPTSAQAYAWPYIWEGDNVVLVSPSSTGKTLAYLLPLLAGCTTFNSSKWPSVLIVVGTSWQARSVHIQVKRILSWISAEKRFRCCCTYIGVEPEAVQHLINGVDVVVGTPPSILRQVAKDALSLRNVQKLVLDGGKELGIKFYDEIHQIVSICGTAKVEQFVTTARTWSAALQTLVSNYIPHPVVITNCSIEALVREKINMRVLCACVSERMSSLLNYVAEGRMIICTSSPDEAIALQQASQLHSWPCLNVQNNEDCKRIDQALADSKLVVISDNVLDGVLQQQLTLDHIVHYSLPSSKTCFRRRLSIFFPAFKKRIQCQCAVILTEEDSSRLAMFADILNRLSQFIPKSLQKMVNLFQVEKDIHQSSYDLCYHLKAWGCCKVDNCPSLHNLMPDDTTKNIGPQPNILPSNGVVEVNVRHVSNATRLWVSLIQHCPEALGDDSVPGHDPGALVLLSLKLAKFYSEPENKSFQDSISEGMYCGLEDSDGSFYRVRVLKFSQPLGFYFPHKEQARVRLIDVGSVLIVDVNQLLVLPDEFLMVPAQVFEVFLCSVIPLDDDRDWSEEAVSFSQRMLQGKTLYGRVALSVKSSQSIWLDPAEQRVTLAGIGVTTALSNSVQELCKAQFSKFNGDHLRKLRQTLGITSVSYKPVSNIEWCSLPLNVESKVYVSAVSSPDFFHVQLVGSLEKLDELEDKLNSLHTLTVSADIPIGCFCVAQFPIDKKWYRGQVMSKTIDQCDIFFVDHGDTEWVPVYLVQHIHPSLLELPAQAIECSFPKGTWASGADDMLWDWTRDVFLNAEVLGVTQSKTHGVTHHSIALRESPLDTCLSKRLSAGADLTSQCLDVSASNLLVKKLVTRLLPLTPARVKFAELLESLLISNPKLGVHSFDDLKPLFNKMPEMEDSVCIHIVRGVCSLLSSTLLEMTVGNSVDWISKLLKRDNQQLFKLCLQVLKFILPHSSYQVPKSLFQDLCQQLVKWKSDFTITAPVLDIVAVIKDILEYEQLGDLVEVCCTVVLSRPVCWSCLEILNLLSTSTTLTPTICSYLPIARFGTSRTFKEAMEHPVLACLVLSLLWNLCQVDSYREQVHAHDWCTMFVGMHNHPVVVGLLKNIFDINTDCGVKVTCIKDSTQSSVSNEEPQVPMVCPKVLWSQRKSHVLLAVQLRACRSHDVIVSPHSVKFRTKVNNIQYGFDLNLFAPVISENYEKRSTASEVLISVRKELCEIWPYLTAENQRLPMFSIDFERWDDSLSGTEGPSKEIREGKTEYRGSLVPRDDTSSESENEDSDNENKEFLDFQL